MMKNFCKACKVGYLFAAFIFSHNVLASEFILLHTNDIHAMIEHTVFDESVGGYARLKSVLKRERNKAESEGLPTITLDAGDFLEGSIFYMANKAQNVLSMHSAMDYSAVALGNHDWLMGASDLSVLLSSVDYTFDLLASNVALPTRSMPGLQKIKPYKLLNISGRKVAILGLTTDEYYYNWAMKGGKITDPIKAGKFWSKKLKAMGVQTVIALTHLGVERDLELIKNTENIDLVIGGHSHTLLVQPLVQKNKAGRHISLVQAGEHAKFLGKLHLNIKDDGQIEVLAHENIEIKDIEEDKDMLEMVAEGRHEVNQMYGLENLKEVIGRSEVDLANTFSEMSVWNMFLTDAFKEALHADIGIHAPALAGPWLKKGLITREMIYQSYPRYFSLDDKRGWRLYRISVFGGVAKMLMEYFLKSDEAIALSGVSFKYEMNNHKKKIKEFKVNGEPIKFFKKYVIAMPEGVIKGGLGATGILLDLLHAIERTEINLWGAIETKIKSIGTIPADYLSRRGYVPTTVPMYSGDFKNLEDVDYAFIPKKTK